MTSPWESIVLLARDIDAAFGRREEPESALVVRLAREVLDFQQQLAAQRASKKEPPKQPGGA